MLRRFSENLLFAFGFVLRIFWLGRREHESVLRGGLDRAHRERSTRIRTSPRHGNITIHRSTQTRLVERFCHLRYTNTHTKHTFFATKNPLRG